VGVTEWQVVQRLWMMSATSPKGTGVVRAGRSEPRMSRLDIMMRAKKPVRKNRVIAGNSHRGWVKRMFIR
jgi:hypothetical protein